MRAASLTFTQRRGSRASTQQHLLLILSCFKAPPCGQRLITLVLLLLCDAWCTDIHTLPVALSHDQTRFSSLCMSFLPPFLLFVPSFLPPFLLSSLTLLCNVTFSRLVVWFLCVVAYFTALGSLGNYDHSNRSMTLVIPPFSFLAPLFGLDL